jgi:hypothetical protein
MTSTLTHEDYTASDHYRADVGLLFDWDQHGCELAYYPANAYTTWTEGDDQTATCTIDRLDNGDPTIRDHSGDVLCGGCAARFLAENDDAVVTVAYQVNGEITGNDDCHDVTCDDCGGTIYSAADVQDLCA